MVRLESSTDKPLVILHGEIRTPRRDRRAAAPAHLAPGRAHAGPARHHPLPVHGHHDEGRDPRQRASRGESGLVARLGREERHPGGGRIVFGCDDHAKNQFLGTRKLKADQAPNVRSTSNLWFVRPEDLAMFGPPSGEGWVRVKALADAKGANAHFAYGPRLPTLVLPSLDAKRPYVDVTDDNGTTWRFPNVNGDTNVVCREVATERDLLYAGGVFYELPAENAGGFAALRPIALADEPVRTLEVDRGLIVVNGRRMALDRLWRNGTAGTAHALWRSHFRSQKPMAAGQERLRSMKVVAD